MFNRLRERASLVYHGGDVSLPTNTPDPNNSSIKTEAPNDESQQPDQPDQPHQQLQSAATDTQIGTGTDTDTARDTDTDTNSSPEQVQGDHRSKAITQSHADDDAHTVNNESDSNSNSQTFFSFFRLSQSATKLTVVDATLPEFNGQDDQTEQDTHSALPPVVEETSTDITSNQSDSGFEDPGTHSQEKPSLLSRMRITATKAFFESSATSLTGSIHSLSASRHASSTTDDATNSKPTPSIDPQHINSDNIDTSNHSTWDFSEQIAQDPDIRRLTEQIHLLKIEYYSTKESGKHAQRRRKGEYSTLMQYFNSKSRELWFASQKMRRFHGLGEYKSELKRCSLPAHDTSAPTLTMEAKLLRAQHQGAILEHQLAIVHEFQQNMIDYLYTKALPDVKAEQELATIVGKSQLEKMIKARDIMVELFEDCLGLQRKIIAKYRLREIEHYRGTDGERLKQEVEHLKVMTGEIPAMERNPELRDSAKRRLEQRLQVKERQLERRKSREEDLIKVTQKLIDDDRALVGKANEQIASISSHSIDLLLDVTGKDDSDDDSGGDHPMESSIQNATKRPHDEMEADTGHDRSQSFLNDTGNNKGSKNLVSTPASANDHQTERGDQSATKEPHDEIKDDSGHDRSQSSLYDMGNDEGSDHSFSSSVGNDENAKDHQTEYTDQTATEEPHEEMENDFGLDTSQSSLNDTGIGDVSDDLFSAPVTKGDNAKDKNTDPTIQCVTKDLHGDVRRDPDVEIYQADDTGDDENPNDPVQISATKDKPSEEVHSQVGQLNADSKEGTEVNTIKKVSSAVVQQPKNASGSQGRSRAAANRSSVTAGRNPPPGIARLRALRGAREMDSSDRSLGSTSNHANEDQGASEHSNSESGEDHLEPISPRTNTRKSELGISANQRYAGRASTTGIRSRNELLERARLARMSNQGGTTGPAQGSTLENAAGTRSVRPSLGIKAMSSRDFASRRSLAITIPSSRSGPGLGGSEHRSSSIVSSSLSSSERSERPRTSVSIAAERQARMERIASRRQSSIEVSAIHQARSDEKPMISAERRAQIRAGLAGRGVGTKLDQGGEDRKE